MGGGCSTHSTRADNNCLACQVHTAAVVSALKVMGEVASNPYFFEDMQAARERARERRKQEEKQNTQEKEEEND